MRLSSFTAVFLFFILGASQKAYTAEGWNAKVTQTYLQAGFGDASVQICLENPPAMFQKTLRYREQHASFEFHFRRHLSCSFTRFSHEINGDTIIFTGFSERRRCHADTLLIKVFRKKSNQFSLEMTTCSERFNYARLYLNSDAAHFYGGGVQFSHFRLNGHRFPIFVEEQGIGRGDLPLSLITRLAGVAGHAFSTYAPIPWIAASDARGYSLNEDGLSYLDFRTAGKIGFEHFYTRIQLDIYFAESLPELLKKYTEDAGRMPLMPDWAFGTWLGLQGGREKVISVTDTAIAYGNPVRAVWIQDWVGKRQTPIGSRLWWRWLPDTIAYGNMSAFVEEMHQRNIRVLGYINPFFTNSGKYFEKAFEKGYFIKDTDGVPLLFRNPGIEFYLLDVFNDAAADFVKKIIRDEMLDVGFSGWMADFGEWMPISNITPPVDERLTVLHNRYVDRWMEINREAVNVHPRKDEIVIFNRSGFKEIAQHSISMWLGDQTTDYGRHDGLPSAITGKLSAAMSGITNMHSDIGGYTNVKLPLLNIIRDRDVLMRWIEMNTFNLIFRTHEGLMPDDNLQVYDDNQIVRFFAYFGKLHYTLKPYLKQLNREAAEFGLPAIRPLFLHFPEDSKVYEILYQYLLGDAFLIAPVVSPNTFKMEVYLPKGNWKHIWSEKKFESRGEAFDISVPYGQPAVFLNLQSENFEKVNELIKSFRETHVL